MVLQALSNLYERLACDDESGIAEFGFSRQKIGFVVLLEADGGLADIVAPDTTENDGRAQISLVVPGGSKPSGSGINPCFLWDNAAYMLGFKPDDPKPERTTKTLDAFRQRHLEAEPKVADPEFSAVCRFLEQWEPRRGEDFDVLSEQASGFGVFRIRGAGHYVHERPAVTDYWLGQLKQEDTPVRGQCLVTGEVAPLARLHEPKIKGVFGGQSAGALLVSFNADAFTSYGKSQSFNAPVAEKTSFQYATALNRLLQRGSPQRIQIGDATTVFWTEGFTRAETIFGQLLDSSAAEDESLKLELSAVLHKIADGRYPDELGDRETPFYVLGLSPNAARLSVRFWLQSNVGRMIERLRQHFTDLEIVRMSDRDPEFPALWLLLRQTAREPKDIPPLLAGALIRAILEGTLYPLGLYQAILRRIKADRQVNYLRAAMLKAFLNRNHEMEVPVSLDPDRPERAYHLGRMFAALEKAQEEAFPGGLNATIKDRYFGAASATPASVFPRLIRLNQHHVSKLDNRAHRLVHEKRIQEVCDRIDGFPPYLNLQDQGLFAVGYYHQRKDFFTKKPAAEVAAASNPEE